MKSSFLLLIIFNISLLAINAQKVLLEQDVKGDTIEKKYGPNLSNFVHFYIGYGFINGPNAEYARIIYSSSTTFEYGIRYKKKITSYYAIGTAIALNIWNYRLKQDTLKLLPNNITHKIEKLIFSTLKGEFYNRINYTKRGNIIGRYLDIGLYGTYALQTVHFTRDDLAMPNENNAKRIDVKNKNLIYVNNYNYGVCGRLGFNWFAITAHYRISNLFNPDINLYPELPKLSVGLEIYNAK